MNRKDGAVEPGGVFRQKEKVARVYAEIHDKDVVPTEGGWAGEG